MAEHFLAHYHNGSAFGANDVTKCKSSMHIGNCATTNVEVEAVIYVIFSMCYYKLRETSKRLLFFGTKIQLFKNRIC